MKRVVWCLVLLICSHTTAQPFYVATNGNDANSGTIQQPFLTIAKAQAVILTLPPQNEKVVVYIRGGDYVQTTPLSFTSKHSGTPAAPVQYVGYSGETARILGGPQITGWTQIDESVADEFGLSSNIVQVNLTEQGITNYGELTESHANRLELFFNDQPMNLSRYPNPGDWMFIQTVTNGSNGNEFTYNGTRPDRWTNATDLWLHGYWTWDWADSYVHVLSIDTSSSLFHTDPSTPPDYGYTANRRYYALNLLVELDEPGEYYLERTTGMLYFYPPSPITSGTTYISMQENVITLQNTSNILFQNLQIMFARTTNVVVNYGENVVIDNCLLANAGQFGATLTDTTSSVISNSEVYGTGDGCVGVYAGDRYTLTSAKNIITNNSLHDYARLDRTYQPGVGWGGVGNVISYNNIFNAPHVGILGGGNNHIFEYNTVHSVCMEVSDSGAFYTGRSWSEQGNILRYNTFRDIRKTTITTSGGTVQGIYLDDQMSGYQVYGNLVENCELGFMLGGGRNNLVHNNTFRGNDNDIEFDNRGMNWQNATCASGGLLQNDLEQYPYQKPPWSTSYPWLVNYLTDKPCVPVGNIIQYNQYCNESFINQTPETVSSWLSTLSDNVDAC